MLAARITLAHFSVSSAMSLPKSAGEPGSSAPPSSSSRVLSFGSSSAALISRLSLSMIPTGVAFGAPTPNSEVASRNEVAHGRDIRQPLPSPGARHGQGAQLAGRDLLNRQRRGAEEHLHLSAQQVAHHGAAAAIRHVDHLDSGHDLEQLAGHTAGSSNAGRAETALARIGLGEGR